MQIAFKSSVSLAFNITVCVEPEMSHERALVFSEQCPEKIRAQVHMTTNSYLVKQLAFLLEMQNFESMLCVGFS